MEKQLVTVFFEQKPNDIRFAHLKNNMVQITHIPASMRHLGLRIDDSLKSINGINIDVHSCKASHQFHNQIVPFKATFVRSLTRAHQIQHDSQLSLDITENTNMTEMHAICDMKAHYIDSLETNSTTQSPITPLSDTADEFDVEDDTIDDHDEYENVQFDCATHSKRLQTCIVSSNALKSGVHEWNVQILKCDGQRQQIGVVGNALFETINDGRSNNQSCYLAKFGAMAMFGTVGVGHEIDAENASNIQKSTQESCTYYASYNHDGSIRCLRDLSNKHGGPGWKAGDLVTVCLNLDKGNIKFYLNGINVRKVMSIQRQQAYYPIIAFSGEGQYALVRSWIRYVE